MTSGVGPRRSGPVDAPPPPPVDLVPPRRRRLRRAAAIALALLVIGAGAFRLWLETCFATPPPLEGEPAILAETPRADPATGRVHLGASWFQERPGRSLLYLEGDPFTRGYANATLTRAFLEEQERSLMETVERLVPSTLARWALATAVLINNRSLPSFVAPEVQLEVLGLARARVGPDPYAAFGSRYHRILNYHAAHDIAHWVWDKPVVACTAFAAAAPHTRDGHLLVGRAFDFEAGRHFDRNKVIALVRPERGHAFLSVVWPGMAGAVTGLNDQRIYCSLNGAHSSDRARIGTPVSLVVRKVLQQADDLAEAIAIVTAARVFVTDTYLIADGETGEAVVVEKTPARTAVRPLEGGALFQANQLETPELKDDPGNRAHMAVGTTTARRARVEELVRARSGELDPVAAVAVLRDRRGLGDAPLPLGHRGAIDALIATHAVVADVTAGVLWVSRGPHGLGAFDPYSIEAFGEPATPVIPADPLLETDALTRVAEARGLIQAAAEAPAEHLADLERALELNPGDPQALLLLGRGLEATGQSAAARRRYAEALAVPPPFGPDRAEAEAALTRLGSD